MAFNSLHTAFEAAVNALLAASLCGEVNMTMSPNYTLDDNGSINGADFRVECVKQAKAMPNGVLMFEPAKLQNGTLIQSSDIKGYELVIKNGCVSGHTVLRDGTKSDPPSVSCYDDE